MSARAIAVAGCGKSLFVAFLVTKRSAFSGQPAAMVASGLRFFRSLLVWLALCASCALPGCYTTELCTREKCDGIDNDCDNKIDEDYRDEANLYTGVDNCGGCGTVCADTFPTATEVA